MKTLLLIMAAFFSTVSQAKLLVYEYGLLEDSNNHGAYVTQIACRNLVYECETVYSESLSLGDLEAIESEFENGDVINMSFSIQKPKPSMRDHFYNASLDEYDSYASEREKTTSL